MTFATLVERLTGRRSIDRPATPPRARVPDDLVVYAVGDVHGEQTMLEQLLNLIRQDAGRRGGQPVLIFLGDYIDRGPASRGVIELLRTLQMPGFEVRCLLGNHEQALLAFLEAPEAGQEWLSFGGSATLMAYGVRPPVGRCEPDELRRLRDALAAAVPVSHLSFLQSLLPWTTCGDYAFVHAGIRPGVALEEQSLDDLLWIRDAFLDWERPHGKRIVHGHTVVRFPQILPNRIGIDTGAFASGILSAVALAGDSVQIIQARRSP